MVKFCALHIVELEYMFYVHNTVDISRRMTAEQYANIMTIIDELRPRYSHVLTIPIYVISDNGIMVWSEVLWLPESVSFHYTITRGQN